ncbi:hypothetical protein KUCAC02_021151 [Chaenocephalus aceratus]|uniref:Uncharacterized protein n=1 Tax=Chaenocephalus aceratus TaxID=36190 RepID=A0ACB9XFY8_CHAAC|nr:hypothetical protein KUCAC02_021151 [Chaenocephalus aceratus]
MGNRFSRTREANSAEAAAPEQKTAAEPAANSGITQVQEAIKTEVLEVVKEEPVAPVPCATQELFSSLPLIGLGVPDVTPEPIDIPPITTAIDADEASDILVTEVCQNRVVESVEELMEVEAADNLEQLASDFYEESVSGLLKNLELKGNDLVADLIPNDVNIPGDMTTSTELM